MTPSHKRKLHNAPRSRQRKRQKLEIEEPTRSCANMENKASAANLSHPVQTSDESVLPLPPILGNLSSTANSVIATKYSTASAPSPVYDMPVPMAVPRTTTTATPPDRDTSNYPEVPMAVPMMEGMNGHCADMDSMDVPLPILNEQYTSGIPEGTESKLTPTSEFQKCHVCGYSTNSNSTDDVIDYDASKSTAKVAQFDCIECRRPRMECNDCVKECSYCYDRDIAKVCWDCQRGYVVLECISCDKVIEFQHASCIGIDWQSLFEQCNHPQCDVLICVDCHAQITGTNKGDTGTFRNCGFCEAGNEYFCSDHCHKHVYQ